MRESSFWDGLKSDIDSWFFEVVDEGEGRVVVAAWGGDDIWDVFVVFE